MEISLEVPQKIKNRTLIQSYHFWIYNNKIKAACYRNSCILRFITELFTIAKLWNQSRCPSTDKWIKKMHMIELYSAIKKNDIMCLTGK
jgi:hypothetical protein